MILLSTWCIYDFCKKQPFAELSKNKDIFIKMKKEFLSLAQQGILEMLQQKTKICNLSLKLSYLIHLQLGLLFALPTQWSLQVT